MVLNLEAPQNRSRFYAYYFAPPEAGPSKYRYRINVTGCDLPFRREEGKSEIIIIIIIKFILYT